MQDKSRDFSTHAPLSAASDIAAERRERIAAEQAARLEAKQRDLMQQTAMESTPEMRVALWERRHGLRLPSNPNHPVLKFVASSTDLDIEQVLGEQRRRAVKRAP